MFDLHLHLPKDSSPLERPAVSWRGLICTSEPSEWTRLPVVTQASDVTGAIGILPESMGSIEQEQTVETIVRKLEEDTNLQIGEVGLDKRFSQRIPMEFQHRFLSQILDIGWQMNRSVSLHVVQAEETLFQILARCGTHVPRLLWHGFTGSLETAKRFARYGGIISLGPSLWRPGLRLAGHLRQLKEYPFAIETDWPEGWVPRGWERQPYPVLFNQHIERLATAMDITVEQLEEQTDAIGTLFTHQQTSWR